MSQIQTINIKYSAVFGIQYPGYAIFTTQSTAVLPTVTLTSVPSAIHIPPCVQKIRPVKIFVTGTSVTALPDTTKKARHACPTVTVTNVILTHPVRPGPPVLTSATGTAATVSMVIPRLPMENAATIINA